MRIISSRYGRDREGQDVCPSGCPNLARNRRWVLLPSGEGGQKGRMRAKMAGSSTLIRLRALFPIPGSMRLPQPGTHVSFADIVEKRHDHAFFNSFCRLIHAMQIRAGRLAGENAVAREDGTHARGVGTGDADLLVDDGLVEDL